MEMQFCQAEYTEAQDFKVSTKCFTNKQNKNKHKILLFLC